MPHSLNYSSIFLVLQVEMLKSKHWFISLTYWIQRIGHLNTPSTDILVQVIVNFPLSFIMLLTSIFDIMLFYSLNAVAELSFLKYVKACIVFCTKPFNIIHLNKREEKEFLTYSFKTLHNMYFYFPELISSLLSSNHTYLLAFSEYKRKLSLSGLCMDTLSTNSQSTHSRFSIAIC